MKIWVIVIFTPFVIEIQDISLPPLLMMLFNDEHRENQLLISLFFVFFWFFSRLQHICMDVICFCVFAISQLLLYYCMYSKMGCTSYLRLIKWNLCVNTFWQILLLINWKVFGEQKGDLSASICFSYKLFSVFYILIIFQEFYLFFKIFILDLNVIEGRAIKIIWFTYSLQQRRHSTSCCATHVRKTTSMQLCVVCV